MLSTQQFQCEDLLKRSGRNLFYLYIPRAVGLLFNRLSKAVMLSDQDGFSERKVQIHFVTNGHNNASHMVRLIYKCLKDNMYSDPAAIPQDECIGALLYDSVSLSVVKMSGKPCRPNPLIQADTDVLARMPVVCLQ